MNRALILAMIVESDWRARDPGYDFFCREMEKQFDVGWRKIKGEWAPYYVGAKPTGESS